jgi:cytochrome c-type biogenesis protein
MDFGLGSYLLGYVAGLLSTLSPCVLPLLPILVLSSLSQHRYGVWALAAGLSLSYAFIGTSLAAFGAVLGLDQTVLHHAGAIMLGLFGLILLIAPLQTRFAALTSGVGQLGNQWLNKLNALPLAGWQGQALLGMVLALVWSPCVGPTLGAAIGLAAQGAHLSQIALLMALFGLGAATPLLLLGTLSRTAMQHWRNRMQRTGQIGKWLMGAALILIAMLMLSGLDKQLETWLVEHSPEWVSDLSTRF